MAEQIQERHGASLRRLWEVYHLTILRESFRLEFEQYFRRLGGNPSLESHQFAADTDYETQAGIAEYRRKTFDFWMREIWRTIERGKLL